MLLLRKFIAITQISTHSDETIYVYAELRSVIQFSFSPQVSDKRGVAVSHKDHLFLIGNWLQLRSHRRPKVTGSGRVI